MTQIKIINVEIGQQLEADRPNVLDTNEVPIPNVPVTILIARFGSGETPFPLPQAVRSNAEGKLKFAIPRRN